MSVQITARIDPLDIDRLRAALGAKKDRLQRIIPRAINDSARWAQGQLARKVRAASGLRLKDVRNLVKLRLASAKNWFADIGLRNYRRTIRAYRLRKYAKGLSYDAGQGRTRVPGAFLAVAPNIGRELPFIRAGKKRYPIRVVYGPRLLQNVSEGDVDRLKAGTASKLRDEIERLIAVDWEKVR